MTLRVHLQRSIAEATADAEHARMSGDSSRTTQKINEAMQLQKALRRLESSPALIGIPAPAAGSAPGARGHGRYSFILSKEIH